jgi:hypothetical protein
MRLLRSFATKKIAVVANYNFSHTHGKMPKAAAASTDAWRGKP